MMMSFVVDWAVMVELLAYDASVVRTMEAIIPKTIKKLKIQRNNKEHINNLMWFTINAIATSTGIEK